MWVVGRREGVSCRRTSNRQDHIFVLHTLHEVQKFYSCRSCFCLFSRLQEVRRFNKITILNSLRRLSIFLKSSGSGVKLNRRSGEQRVDGHTFIRFIRSHPLTSSLSFLPSEFSHVNQWHHENFHPADIFRALNTEKKRITAMQATTVFAGMSLLSNRLE